MQVSMSLGELIVACILQGLIFAGGTKIKRNFFLFAAGFPGMHSLFTKLTEPQQKGHRGSCFFLFYDYSSSELQCYFLSKDNAPNSTDNTGALGCQFMTRREEQQLQHF